MRVVSLLPAATEIVAALGGAGTLVGISHECDYPDSVLGLPRVTSSPIDPEAGGPVIDAEVRRLHAAGVPVIGVDAQVLHQLAPDLIITQALCEVCAVAEGEVHRLGSGRSRLARRSSPSQAGRWRGSGPTSAPLLVRIDLEAEGDELVTGLRSRVSRLRSRDRTAPPPRVLCVEWLEPLYLAGHWVPELVEAAGGQDVGAAAGGHSARREWPELASLEPDVVIVMLCGFGVERSLRELTALRDAEALALFGSVAHLAPRWQRVHVPLGSPRGGRRGAGARRDSRTRGARSDPLAVRCRLESSRQREPKGWRSPGASSPSTPRHWRSISASRDSPRSWATSRAPMRVPGGSASGIRRR